MQFGHSVHVATRARVVLGRGATEMFDRLCSVAGRVIVQPTHNSAKKRDDGSLPAALRIASGVIVPRNIW